MLNGRATFSTLAISQPGIYVIDFRVSSPAVASTLKAMSVPVNVTRAMLSARVIAQPEVTNTSQPFLVRLQIVDSFTLKAAEDPSGLVSARME